jgi:hypothetical protein
MGRFDLVADDLCGPVTWPVAAPAVARRSLAGSRVGWRRCCRYERLWRVIGGPRAGVACYLVRADHAPAVRHAPASVPVAGPGVMMVLEISAWFCRGVVAAFTEAGVVQARLARVARDPVCGRSPSGGAGFGRREGLGEGGLAGAGRGRSPGGEPPGGPGWCDAGSAGAGVCLPGASHPADATGGWDGSSGPACGDCPHPGQPGAAERARPGQRPARPTAP